MGRSPCCSKVGLKRGPWADEEDALLTDFIQKNGEGEWKFLPKKAGLLRCGKSCRLRWMNYLRPGINRGHITEDEEDLIVRLHRLVGNRWTLIAGRLPGRTDNDIKNHWNTHIVKKLKKAGIHHEPHRFLPKPSRLGKTSTGAGASLSKKKEEELKKARDNDKASRTEEANADSHKIKVYMPKPIRLTSAFSRNDSLERLPTAFSSSGGVANVQHGGREAEVSYEPMDWLMCGMEDRFDEDFGGGDDFLAGYCPLPTPQSGFCDDFMMWDHIHDEYLNLI